MNNILFSFKKTVEELSDAPCIWYEHRNKWREISWNRFYKLVFGAAAGLKKMGIKKGDRVAVFGPTAWEWSWADLALLAAGAIVVPIYPTLPPDAVKGILDDAGIEVVIGDFMLWKEKNNPDINFISWRLEGEKCLGNLYREGKSEMKKTAIDAQTISLDDIATIVYTSGTTGHPKGVMISHKNIAAEIKAVRKVFLFPHHYIGIACLPLSHVLGRMLQFYQLAHGCQTAYVPDLTKLANAYKTIKPHYMCAVPRLLEKIEEGVYAVIKKKPKFEQKLFSWSKKVGNNVAEKLQWHKKIPTLLKLKYYFAYITVFRKIRNALGGRINSIISGGAPLSSNLAKLLTASKIKILEGYGLTETFAAAAVNRMDDFRIGTVGKPVEDVDMKFSEEGELLIKGPIVFEGYWQKNDLTRDAFTEDGWFKSGDIGEFTRDGFVRLTSRKKDVIITSGGKNVSPTIVEDKLKEIPFITQSVLYGDGKKFLSAIIVIDPPRLREEAKNKHLKIGEDLSICPITYNLVQEAIDEKNEHLASFERVRKFIILPRPLSIENGELTPTLKIRRKLITEKFRDQLDSLYG